MRGAISRMELIAAEALLQMHYGDKINVQAQGEVGIVAPETARPMVPGTSGVSAIPGVPARPRVPVLPARKSQRKPRERQQRVQRKQAPKIQSSDSEDSDKDAVAIGSGRTIISKEKFKKVKWQTFSQATRCLLSAVFSRSTLATHSMTGQPSPAFADKPAKKMLDPVRVSDIIMEVSKRFNVPYGQVRKIVTTKCADECKEKNKRNEKKPKKGPKRKRGDRSRRPAPSEL